MTGQSLALAVDNAARALERLPRARLVHRPALRVAQDGGALVDGEIAPDRPAEQLANRPDDGRETRVAAVRAGQRSGDRMLERDERLLALARGDVLRDAAVSGEGAGAVEHGLAAHADPAHAATVVEARELSVAEWLSFGEPGPERLPVLRGHVEVRQLPRPRTERALAQGIDPGLIGAGETDKAKLGVLLP